MFRRLFRRSKKEENFPPKKEDNSCPIVKETLEMLKKGEKVLEEGEKVLQEKEKVWQKKIQAEAEKAKEFAQAKNKKAAIQCLKRKKLYERKIEDLGDYNLAIHEQMSMLEGAEATTQAVAALRTAASAMKSVQPNIEYVDKIMDDINEQKEKTKQIQDAFVSAAAADFDDDELDAELEKLKGAELEEQLLQPAVTAPATPYIRAGRRPTSRTSHSSHSSSTQSGTTTC